MRKSMKIAIMVRAYIPMPRPADMIYAPIDLAIEIAKGLGERGHKVTLFGPIGTEVYGHNVTVETLNLRPLVRNQNEFNELLDDIDKLANYLPSLWDSYMVNEIYKRAEAGEFDVVHFHHPHTALPKAMMHPLVPTLYTLHDPVYDWYREVFELYDSPNQHYVSISNNQRRDAPDLRYKATVYNGTDVDLFTFNDKAEDFLLFAGRITPQKGVKEAIEVAKKTDHRLLIIGPVAHGAQGYFDQYIKPELNDRILYLGRMDQEQLPTYYQKAKAVLTPVQWEEPFGLTTVEAMACGTPVISLRRGAAPEIIVNGKTGFVVNSVGDMIKAVGKLDKINRRDCREHIENKFALQQMVDGYEKVFCSLTPKPGFAAGKLSGKRAQVAIKKKITKVKKVIKQNL